MGNNLGHEELGLGSLDGVDLSGSDDEPLPRAESRSESSVYGASGGDVGDLLKSELASAQQELSRQSRAIAEAERDLHGECRKRRDDRQRYDRELAGLRAELCRSREAEQRVREEARRWGEQHHLDVHAEVGQIWEAMREEAASHRGSLVTYEEGMRDYIEQRARLLVGGVDEQANGRMRLYEQGAIRCYEEADQYHP